MERIAAFVDGFNIYHAIDDLRERHLKWLNLWALLKSYAPKANQQLVAVYYFTAYATWLPDAYKRHRAYVAALEAVGVTPVLGFFKEKNRKCKRCGTQWISHEEKETDVHIGLYMLNEAHLDNFDRALLLSTDSDLSPVVRMMRKEFPHKPMRVIAPPGRKHSKQMIAAFEGSPSLRSIKKGRLRRCLLPEHVSDSYGNPVATRPAEYEPPT